nr:terminase small subunit [uncultured Oscillibacter sp.]
MEQGKEKSGRQNLRFCTAYLRTMDPEEAARAAGRKDGFDALAMKSVRRRLERMRGAAAGELKREDALRRLAQLAFGRANDAARLALNPREVDPGALDLSAVAEIKVTDKGGVEVKLVDRVRALETLCGLLEERGGGAEELYRALEEAAEQLEDGYGG